MPLALIVIGTGAAFSLPATRHLISGWWNVPDGLPALSDNNLVHYEPGAEEFARDVAKLLPAAVARVEAVQGRRFAQPVTLGAYATPEAYMAANGIGSMGPVGTTLFGRINLSPKLFSLQRRRLPGILTHELSHAHIQGWLARQAWTGSLTYVALPNWFKEGLAVMVSDGGGAELVSEEEARQAISRGEQIEINDAGSLFNLTEIRFARAPAQQDPAWYPTVLAYREAGLFVSYLHESDRAAFDRMMKDVLDGRTFAEAMRDAYHSDAKELWEKFKTSFART
ncbi:hypothetical protein JQ604_05635 [Bradyrhizobium jicamae]|uniref:hypothetical protein n=1 Tax=Bradyrhizobium jicamae TaxID=280332 RepID=UPI001BAA0D9D|nr:hypothetical protein [Bradyrhizobium jicamae]MBR0751655.1 hypothetical protein [Bradyrhizobium jicamae]